MSQTNVLTRARQWSLPPPMRWAGRAPQRATSTLGWTTSRRTNSGSLLPGYETRREQVAMLRTEEGYRQNRLNRRKYYGQAGRYRVKPYGVEWRTPSNVCWHAYMEGQVRGLFNTINIILPLVKQGVTVHDIGTPVLIAKTRELINVTGLGSRKRIKAVADSWKSRIEAHPATWAMVEEDIGHGNYPTLYAT